MNELFSNINGFFEKILFFDIFFGQIEGVSFPFVVAWLIAGGVFLTFKMGFVNLKTVTTLFSYCKRKIPHKR